MTRQEFKDKFSEVCVLFEQIESQSRTTAKIALLASYKDQEFLKQILLYTYNPYFVYGINKKTFEAEFEMREMISVFQNGNFETVFECLDFIKTSISQTDERKYKLIKFVHSFDDNLTIWLERLILKDLKIGINIETINKVFPKLVPTFKVALFYPYESPSDIKSDTVIEQPKLDGARCVAIIKEDCGVEMFTRNGSKIEGYDEILEELSNEIFKGYVFDGEIMGSNFDNTMEGLFAKGQRKEAVYTIFDCMTVSQFLERKCDTPYSTRIDTAINLISEWQATRTTQILKTITSLVYSKKEADFEKSCNFWVRAGYEGIMIKNPHAPYEFKRTKNCLKYKTMLTDEFTIIDFKEGEGKYLGTLGAIYIEVPECKDAVKVGSGFSDEQRDYIWKNRNKLSLTQIEVQYQEKTKDGSLRFPVFLKFRDDK